MLVNLANRPMAAASLALKGVCLVLRLLETLLRLSSRCHPEESLERVHSRTVPPAVFSATVRQVHPLGNLQRQRQLLRIVFSDKTVLLAARRRQVFSVSLPQTSLLHLDNPQRLASRCRRRLTQRTTMRSRSHRSLAAAPLSRVLGHPQTLPALELAPCSVALLRNLQRHLNHLSLA
jgi:hypothetical protein